MPALPRDLHDELPFVRGFLLHFEPVATGRACLVPVTKPRNRRDARGNARQCVNACVDADTGRVLVPLTKISPAERRVTPPLVLHERGVFGL